MVKRWLLLSAVGVALAPSFSCGDDTSAGAGGDSSQQSSVSGSSMTLAEGSTNVGTSSSGTSSANTTAGNTATGGGDCIPSGDECDLRTAKLCSMACCSGNVFELSGPDGLVFVCA